MAIHLVSTRPNVALLDLPWDVPLAAWRDDLDVPLARGVHRHVVRFVRVGHEVYAIKETRDSYARGEYALLRNLQRLALPTVEPIGVVTGRTAADGSEIEPALVTRHLVHSLPYRSLFTHSLQEDTLERMIDALVVLLVRLHNEGFFWGDCSLSNTLFRRSAGEFAAYLVDAETGELHEALTNGQRRHDLELLRTNVYGELLDLQACETLDAETDALGIVDRIERRYDTLWQAITGVEEFGLDEMWRVEQRIEQINDLGFDIEEIDIVTDFDGDTVRVQPQVVEAGHHARRLQGLTGLDLEEQQARRLLNDLDAFAAAHALQGEDAMVVAHRWLTEVYQPLRQMIPPEQRDAFETAEVFHNVLVHRWLLSQSAGHEVDFFDAVRSYVQDLLPTRAASVRTAERDTPTSG